MEKILVSAKIRNIYNYWKTSGLETRQKDSSGGTHADVNKAGWDKKKNETELHIKITPTVFN